MPTSAQSVCLPLTYHREPGSSPTRTVPRPGTTPRSPSLATRSVSSPLMALAVAVPSRICAVTGVIQSVEEVPGAGEVHRDPGGLQGVDDLRVPERSAGLHDRRDARLHEDLRAVREREESVARGDRANGPLPRPL